MSLQETDELLATRARGGDAHAFGALVDRHVASARRLARSLLLDPEDADDAVQDGLLAAWRAIGSYDPLRPFRPWLQRIVLNAARDLRRRRTVRRTEPLPFDRASEGADPAVDAERADLRRRLDEALVQLPERQRVVVTLFDVEGYPHADIAGLLGVPEGTVRSDLHHARRRLRTALGPVFGPRDEEEEA